MLMVKSCTDVRIYYLSTERHTHYRHPFADESSIDSYRIHFITSTILSEVRDIVLSTNQNYIETLALDRKVRDCAIELFGAPIGCRQASGDTLNIIIDTYDPGIGRPRGSERKQHCGYYAEFLSISSEGNE